MQYVLHLLFFRSLPKLLVFLWFSLLSGFAKKLLHTFDLIHILPFLTFWKCFYISTWLLQYHVHHPSYFYGCLFSKSACTFVFIFFDVEVNTINCVWYVTVSTEIKFIWFHFHFVAHKLISYAQKNERFMPSLLCGRNGNFKPSAQINL